jgi:hypothetical protein
MPNDHGRCSTSQTEIPTLYQQCRIGIHIQSYELERRTKKSVIVSVIFFPLQFSFPFAISLFFCNFSLDSDVLLYFPGMEGLNEEPNNKGQLLFPYKPCSHISRPWLLFFWFK